MRTPTFPHSPLRPRLSKKQATTLVVGAALAIASLGVAHAQDTVINPEEGIWFVDSLQVPVHVRNVNPKGEGIEVFGGKTGLHASGGDIPGGDGTGEAIFAEGFAGNARGLRAEAPKVALEAKTTGVTDDGTAIRAAGGKTAGFGLEASGNTAVDASGRTGGVNARSSEGVAVRASGKTGGVLAQASGANAAGVSAFAFGGGPGVYGEGKIGGDFKGSSAPVRLEPSVTQGAPDSSTGAHKRGELYVDNQGTLFLCTADGTPGTWKQVVLK